MIAGGETGEEAAADDDVPPPQRCLSNSKPNATNANKAVLAERSGGGVVATQHRLAARIIYLFRSDNRSTALNSGGSRGKQLGRRLAVAELVPGKAMRAKTRSTALQP